MNAIQEQRLMNRFQESYVWFPEGDLVKSEPPLPDYVLTNGDSTIGIELTEIFHDGSAKARASFKNKITELVITKLEAVMPFRFSLDVFPSETTLIPKHAYDSLSNTLANLCFREFYRLTDGQTAELEHIELDLKSPEYRFVKREILAKGYRNLPHGIERMRMTRHDIVDYSYNASSEAGIVPDLSLEHLQKTISKKESLLGRYGTFAACWLVIQEGNYFTGTFSELSFSVPVQSLFDKVFLFRLPAGEIVELK